MQRGELWWADLPEPVASEPGYRRPVLIVQIDELNQSPIATVMVAAVSSNLKLARARGNVLVPASQSGLSRDSVVNVTQIATADKRFLTERIRVLHPQAMREVEQGLRLVLGL